MTVAGSNSRKHVKIVCSSLRTEMKRSSSSAATEKSRNVAMNVPPGSSAARTSSNRCSTTSCEARCSNVSTMQTTSSTGCCAWRRKSTRSAQTVSMSLAAGVRLQLGKQLAVEVDGGDGETEPRKGNRLEAAAGAQVDRACRLTRRNAARREELRVARERRVPAAVHPRIDVGEQAVVVLLDGGHGAP